MKGTSTERDTHHLVLGPILVEVDCQVSTAGCGSTIIQMTSVNCNGNDDNMLIFPEFPRKTPEKVHPRSLFQEVSSFFLLGLCHLAHWSGDEPRPSIKYMTRFAAETHVPTLFRVIFPRRNCCEGMQIVPEFVDELWDLAEITISLYDVSIEWLLLLYLLCCCTR